MSLVSGMPLRGFRLILVMAGNMDQELQACTKSPQPSPKLGLNLTRNLEPDKKRQLSVQSSSPKSDSPQDAPLQELALVRQVPNTMPADLMRVDLPVASMQTANKLSIACSPF